MTLVLLPVAILSLGRRKGLLSYRRGEVLRKRRDEDVSPIRETVTLDWEWRTSQRQEVVLRLLERLFGGSFFMSKRRDFWSESTS